MKIICGGFFQPCESLKLGKKLIRDDLCLLHLMLEDMGRQQDMYRPGPYWSGYAQRVRDALHEKGLTAFRSNPAIVKGYGFAYSQDPLSLLPSCAKKTMLKWLRSCYPINKICQGYIQTIEHLVATSQNYQELFYTERYAKPVEEFLCGRRIPESNIARPNDMIHFLGENISASYIHLLLKIMVCAEGVAFHKARTVFEIGGGYGIVAHLLLSLYPNIKKYIYLDIPPMLYVGTQYLKSLQLNVRDYRETSNMELISFSNNDEVEILAVAPWQIGRLSKTSFDVFYNSASFQEMTRDQLKNYIQHIASMAKDGSSQVCLAMYPEKNKDERRTKTEEIVKMFSRHFPLEQLHPKYESHFQYEYYANRASSSER